MSCETTKSFVSKVFLAKKLKHVGFSRKSIFNNLIKAGKFDKILVQHEENLNNVFQQVETDLRVYVKKHKKTMAKEELKLIEEKQRKELEKAKRELEEETSESEGEEAVAVENSTDKPTVVIKPKSVDEDDIESDQEPTRENDQQEKIYNLENDNESMKEEIEYLKAQLEEKNKEITQLKKKNFRLNKKMKQCKCDTKI